MSYILEEVVKIVIPPVFVSQEMEQMLKYLLNPLAKQPESCKHQEDVILSHGYTIYFNENNQRKARKIVQKRILGIFRI